MASAGSAKEIMTVDSELRLVILGKTGVGKSTLGSLMAGEKDVFPSNADLTSCTRECQHAEFEYKGQKIKIVDTPGFCDPGMDEKSLNKELKRCLELTSPGIHAFLYTVKTQSFTKEDQDILDWFLSKFGKAVVDHVIIIFTGKDDLDFHNKSFEDTEKPPGLNDVMTRCKGRHVVLCAREMNSRDRYLEDILRLVTQVVNANSGRCYTNDMFRDVAIELLKVEQKKRYDLVSEEMKLSREEIKKMLNQADAKKLHESIDDLVMEMKLSREEEKRKSQPPKGVLPKVSFYFWKIAPIVAPIVAGRLPDFIHPYVVQAAVNGIKNMPIGDSNCAKETHCENKGALEATH